MQGFIAFNSLLNFLSGFNFFAQNRNVGVEFVFKFLFGFMDKTFLMVNIHRF